ncbi:MAG: hypothetical protein EH225_01050 [Calditrichaeota bacterium]|nr:hypothetical protein [Calditrichota bacterium]RQW07795.1 MAG: hypothetical protein EH225_01050 [Calditrichota bacterium]
MKRIMIFSFLIGIHFLNCDPEKLFRDAPVITEMKVYPDRVNPFDTVYAEVEATNPEEGLLSYQWSVSPSAGSFADPVDGSEIRWIAPTTGGDYSIKIIVYNDYKSTEQKKIVTVIESAAPLVRILSPQDGEYLVQWSPTEISLRAIHNNGINRLFFYINDVFQAQQSGGSSGEYVFNFTPDSSLLGKTEIKIEAIANFVTATGADSIMVNIEAVLPSVGR